MINRSYRSTRIKRSLRGGREQVRPPPHPAAFMVPPIARAELATVNLPLFISEGIEQLSELLKREEEAVIWS